MRDTLTHRGPDAAGVFVEQHVALGHRRLSIVDVSHGHQPMHSADGRYVLTYNGEVFNHPALKSELEQTGVHYATRSDTETILHLFEHDGPASVRRMRGMFAFAIWDRQTNSLTLARDRFGVKPLYYVLASDGSLFFASEIKALLAAGAVKPKIHLGALPDYLANFAPSGQETLFSEVKRLPAGHVLHWQDGRVRIEQYWDLPVGEPVHTGSDADLVEEFRERFTEAVRLRLMSDVPLGVFLSGGIDSAAITCTMAKLVNEPIRSFSVAFAEREANELAYARIIARHVRSDHHEVTLAPDDFFAALPRLVWHEDEPIAHPSSVALWAVSQLASEHVKVVLTGEGSDELLGGYNRYRVTMMNARMAQWWSRLAPAVARSTARDIICAGNGALFSKLSRTFVGRTADLDSLYLDNFAVYDRAGIAGLLSSDTKQAIGTVDPYFHMHEALDRRRGRPLLEQLLYADAKTFLHELLMKQDQMSMAASIESRVPFLDHPLAEWVTRLPEHLRIDGAQTKVILRRAMEGILPHEILHRKKMGFPVPIGAWFRGRWKSQVIDIVAGERAAARGLFDMQAVNRLVAEHMNGRSQAQKLWSLLNLELWQRVHLDGDMTAALPDLHHRAAA